MSNQVFLEAYSCTSLAVHPAGHRFIAQSAAGYAAIFNTRAPYKLDKTKVRPAEAAAVCWPVTERTWLLSHAEVRRSHRGRVPSGLRHIQGRRACDDGFIVWFCALLPLEHVASTTRVPC